jgi:predicted nucleotidyltransferase
MVTVSRMGISRIVKSLIQHATVETIMQFGSSLEKKDFNDIDICIFTRKKVSLRKKLSLLRDIPPKFDVCFYDDLPLHIKHEVLTKGKILHTKNYYQLLKYVQYVDLEYPRYKLFLEEYHQEMVAAL